MRDICMHREAKTIVGLQLNQFIYPIYGYRFSLFNHTKHIIENPHWYQFSKFQHGGFLSSEFILSNILFLKIHIQKIKTIIDPTFIDLTLCSEAKTIIGKVQIRRSKYRVFIKYCVFSKNSRKFATSPSLLLFVKKN